MTGICTLKLLDHFVAYPDVAKGVSRNGSFEKHINSLLLICFRLVLKQFKRTVTQTELIEEPLKDRVIGNV
mgnify:CR=1 FL=1